MLVNSVVKFQTDKQRIKQKGYLSHDYLSSKNITVTIQDIKRPLNTNHSDLSFKGLSLSMYKPLSKVYSKKEFLEFADKYVGDMGRELLEDITIKHKNRTSKLISIDGDNIIINKKTVPHLAWDGILYPFKILPTDMLNGMVEMLGHIPFLKNWSARTLEKPLFKNIRQRSKIDAKVNSLTGLITYRDIKIDSAKEAYAKKYGKKVAELTAEEIEKITADVDKNMTSSVIKTELKQFDPKTGNYDTKHERALNRLVSGLPPAIFLANDAYNLSRMMDDNATDAQKERKIRFKQETSRILTSGYLTLITMGAFQKFINKSKAGIMLVTGLTVLVTEMFSRLSNGKHITRITPEKAREINEREHNPEANIKPNAQVSSTGTNDVKSKEQQKPLLSFSNLWKASLAILGIGYGIKGVKNLPSVKKAAFNYLEKKGITDINLDNAVKTFEDKVLYKPFTDLYKKLTTEGYTVKVEQFDQVVKILRENGFDKFADQYDKIGKSALKTLDDGTAVIDFQKRDRKIKPLVNFVIAPFKFMWNTVTLPYWMIDEKLMNVFRKSKPKAGATDLQMVAHSFDKILKQATKKNFNADEFKDFVQINLLKAWNVDSLSSVSNAELSNLAKTAASIATIWFLMTDNYNMVMLKSNGNDKDGADTKFKERFVQEGSRLFYQTLLIDLFNSTFMKSYNGSLLGMSWVTLADTTLGEILTRSSVGIPIKAHTRDELIAIETEQNNSTGFKKKYYNFMQRLTGKRSIKSYEIKSKNETAIQPFDHLTVKPQNEVTMSKQIFFSNNGTLDKLIKG